MTYESEITADRDGARRPPSSLTRARLKTYQVLSRFRHGRNRAAEVEPGAFEKGLAWGGPTGS